MEVKANFTIDFAWIVVMEAAKGKRVVQQDTAIADIGGMDGDSCIFAKGLA